MIATAFTKKTVAPVTEIWTRPDDWLPLPQAPAQGLVGLCAVPPEGAYIALMARTSVAAANGGRYVVDWGDGSALEEIPENTIVYKTLSYASYSNNSARGYRQALIKVTPKTGQNLTVIQLKNHTAQPYASTPWLDLEINGTTALTQVLIGSTSVFNRQLERVKIHSFGNTASLADLFRNCIYLQEVILPSTTKATSMPAMFYNCISLANAPAMDTSNVTNMSSMFYNCVRLKTAPSLNTAKVTNMSSMFYGCASLENVQPSFTTGLCTTLASMFQGCYKLKTPPTFSDTSKVTTIASIFNGCLEMVAAPEMNCSLVTNIASAFTNCAQLTALPSYVFPEAITDARYFISGARKIKSLANLTFSSTIWNMGDFANGAWSLSAVPALNVSPSTNNALSFNRCFSLADVPVGFMAGAKSSADFRYNSLSATALNKIFSNLATIPSTQATKPIIYIRGNSGADTCDTTLATGKNWVVDKITA